MKIAIYPGSFDPITLGHMDIIRRAAQCFDQVYVCVLVNCDKKPMFSADERVEMIRRSVADLPNVAAVHYTGLLAQYARDKGACVLVKGLRNATDFDQEYQMASINRGILPGLETVFPAGQSRLPAFQQHHGPGNAPLRTAHGTICAGPGGRAVERTVINGR